LNFLAHLTLSEGKPLHMVGNYAGDFVKGRNLTEYPSLMQKGITAHRLIDSFTDTHPTVQLSAALFRPAFGKYSGIAVDILYDHFLSQNWHKIMNIPRQQFIGTAHETLWNYRHLLPARAKRLLPSLIYQQYLSAYISFYGLRRVFLRMASRTSLPDASEELIRITKINYSELNRHFLAFYSELQHYVRTNGL